jgi:hypothetical protein
MRRSIFALCLIAVAGLFMYSSYESPTTLVGDVFMEAGETAPFAEIKIYSAENHQLVRAELADINGNFTFSDLETGDYILEVSYVGYEDYKIPVALTSNKETSTVNVDLESEFDDAEFAARPVSIKRVKA